MFARLSGLTMAGGRACNLSCETLCVMPCEIWCEMRDLVGR